MLQYTWCLLTPFTEVTHTGGWAKRVVLPAVAAPSGCHLASPMVPLCMCRVSVVNVLNKQRRTAVPLHRHCKFSTCWAHQIYHAGEETADVKQAASLTFPASCWADKALTMLQFYAYTLNPPYPVHICLLCLMPCTPAVKAWHMLDTFGLLRNCDSPRKHQSGMGAQSVTFPQSRKISNRSM